MADVLNLPDWPAGPPRPWQAPWADALNAQTVAQHDQRRPLRGDWLVQLENAVLAQTQPVWLLASGLACHLVAAWAAHSRHTHGVRAAFLVEPNLPDQPDLATQLPSWRQPLHQALPFPSLVLGPATHDPTTAALQGLARHWGADYQVDPAPRLNTDWPSGWALFNQWRQRT